MDAEEKTATAQNAEPSVDNTSETSEKKVRFGIIGLGNQGSYYALSLFAKGEIPGGTVTAMCDSNPQKIENMKEKFTGDVAYFSDYRLLLASGLCDAILVETPHYFHPEIVVACLECGLHVICDKPAGVYTAQVREMNEAAARTAEKAKAEGKPVPLFTMMFNQRTNCLYRRMREIIAEGGIGELQRVTWIITNWFRTKYYYDSGSWRATWQGEGGGVLINQSPHQLDLVQWIVGSLPSRVHGFCQYGKWHDIEVEDEVTAFFEYPNGATGVFITSTGEAPGTNRLEISGTKGKLLCEKGKLWFTRNETPSDELSLTATTGFATPKCHTEEVQTDGENPQHKGIINNFTDAILHGAPLFVRGEEGIRGVELMNAIELSGWKNGAPVTIPVDEKEYLTFLDQKRAASRQKTGNDNAVADTNNTFWNVKV